MISVLQTLSLIKAIKDNDISTIKTLASNSNAILMSVLGSTKLYPIHVAAQYNRLDIIQFICEQKPKALNQIDSYGQTALIFAAKLGHTDVVQSLVSMGASLNHTTTMKSDNPHHGKSGLYWAVEKKHCAIVNILLNAGATIDVLVGDINFHPIHIAARNGCLEIIQLLIKKNSSLLDKKDAFEQTPILWAASRGHVDIVQFLISLNANLVSITINPGTESHEKNVLHWAITGGHCAVVRILIQAGAIPLPLNGLQPIHLAVHNKGIETLQFLLEEYYKNSCTALNQIDTNGQTALLWAASRGHIEAVQYLISKNADLNVATNKLGSPHHDYTALHWAIEKGHCAIVKLLIQTGATILPLHGMQLIHIAAQNGHVEIVKFLFEEHHQTNPELLNQINHKGETPLFIAASAGHDSVALYLIDQGADLNLGSNQRGKIKTPIDQAIENNHYFVANLLMIQMLRINDQTQDQLLHGQNQEKILNNIKTGKHALEFIIQAPEKANLLLNNKRIEKLIINSYSRDPNINYYKRADRRPSFFAQINRTTGESTVYTPHRALGGGAYGDVRDFVSTKGDHVAIKSLKENLIDENNPNSKALIEAYEEQLQEEARFMAQTYPSSGLYKTFSFRKDFLGKNKYTNRLVMEYLEGEPAPLYITKIQCKNTLAKTILLMAESLNALHNNNIIHGDIKLDNLLIATTGHDIKVKYIDFGMSYSLWKTNPTLTGESPHYPPERIGPTTIFSSRIFSLFLKPHKNQDIFSLAHMLDNILYSHPLGSELVETFPSVIRFIQRALSRSAEKRPELNDFIEELSIEYKLALGEMTLSGNDKIEISAEDYSYSEDDWVEIDAKAYN